MKEEFRTIKFHKRNVILLEKIKEILQKYDERGIKVTLRQLYYQLVSKDLIPNKQSAYSKLSTLLTNARYTGDIDWDAIEDRVRIPKIPNTFEDINSLMRAAAQSYHLDRWEGQEYYIELWTEKDAISSVISPITKKYQVTMSVNRGYSSATSMYESAQRFLDHEDKTLVLLYLGDHDPSGLDMDRDVRDRLKEFGVDVSVIRIGLTMQQIEELNPPQNPAKITDPRATEYIKKYGAVSWEVDAIPPEELQQLIEKNVLEYLDLGKYHEILKRENEEREEIKKIGKVSQ